MADVDDRSVTFWLQRLKEGDEDAAQQVWNRYFPRLIGLAKEKLGRTPRGMADEEDVALSVMQVFYRDALAGKFPKLDNRDDLWKVLVLLTRRKAVDRWRHENRDKRSPDIASDGLVPDVNVEELADLDPDPAFAVLFAELYSRLMAELSSNDDLYQIAIAKLQGESNETIAKKRGCTPRTIMRKLVIIRKLWEKAAE